MKKALYYLGIGLAGIFGAFLFWAFLVLAILVEQTYFW